MTTETMTTTETTADAATDAVETSADTALASAATADDGADKGEGDKADDVTDKAADTVVEGAPEAYDAEAWKLPEGITFDKEGFEAVEPVLRDLNLSNDQAGKLMGAYAEKVVPLIEARVAQAQDDAAAQLRADLARDLQADPEVGGKMLDESKAFAAKAIAHFIPDKDERNEFSTFLNESGLGNHRLLMRLVTGAGKAISEASTVAAETASKPVSEAEKFYGKG